MVIQNFSVKFKLIVYVNCDDDKWIYSLQVFYIATTPLEMFV